MTVRLQRPILIGGLGLTAGLWGLDSVYHSLSGVGDWLTIGSMAAGGGYWWYSRQSANSARVPTPQTIDRAALDRILNQIQLVIGQLTIESPNSPQIERLKQQLATVKTNLTRPDRHIAITGGQKVGKSSLLNLLTTNPVTSATPLKYIETPALFGSGADSQTAATTADRIALNADLVLFLTNGDLTATEYKYLEMLDRASQRVVLVLDRASRYLPEERNLVLQKLQSTVAGTIAPQDVVTIGSTPEPIKVRKIQADGTAIETLETLPVEIGSLDRQLSQILAAEGEKLVVKTAYRQGSVLQTNAKAALNAIRRERALSAIEQNQWIVAAATFANPLPALDLVATAAINVQMVVDLGAIYQQKFSLSQAQAAAGAMGTVAIELGIVEICTQAVAGILKTNAVTYAAGGLVQGLSAAYLTRIAGLTLVEYLEAQDLVAPEPAREWNLDLLGNTIQKVFQANERVAYLQTIVRQGVDRLVSAG